ncbi:fructose-1,6-bisphosphatase [Eggerthella lenta]|uniref:fructose-1,6-bisphosphatase n=1 Tax=Eggerthella lenta TaxID=84112 RepID=UPI000DF75960|nr:fructose-1,6-bisphosphatase [Eggerthella lenta]MCQ4796666.1 fructose-1,6-bisphosphatase [Eggerthella lenta]MDB1769075.1 fructose-1,6-bisphosphatase [Eggerthella lenta]MDU5351717.1 fructose-1,6-bisphosphatase [Eggerthella sp.]RDC07968.1 class 3 fructose-bisphosphatase [Eggerthella lenta]
MDATDMRYLELLSRLFPSADKASAEIINLSAILNLPKGTEFFASDIHGEYEAFSHTLRNGSGSIRLKIDDVFGDSLSENEKRSLATLIYYPREKMELVLSQVDDAEAWYAVTLQRLVAVCKRAAQKYTRSRVRKALPKDFAYIIEELMTENRHGVDKQAYYAAIVDAVIRTDRGGALVEALCLLIQRLAIERLHIVGDIYDRGPYPHIIMDALMEHHSLDIQWGNHDIVWMGASLGQRGCIAHVVRNCARYGNLSILEDAYGINILPLASFALDAYKDDPCVAFGLKGNPDLPPQELEMNVKIQKAMAIIQFKVEAQLIDENPGFGLEDRKLLDKIDYENGTVMLDGVAYELTDTVFPTVDPADPYRLTPEEEEVMQRLEQAFTGCEKLQRHMRFFLDAGSLYKVCNGNLLFHACVPLNADGSLMETEVFGETYKGRALYDVMERYVRAAFDDANPELAKRGRDLLWYMWLGEGSPLFAKSKMATFELYLIAEKEARKEVKNSFYSYLDDERVMGGIFEDFGMDPETSRIVCGHVPVKVKDGEDPVKCGGRVLTIDGGFSKAYQPTTGIAGYTLISNSYGFVLAAHEPLESMRAAVVNELDIHSSRKVVELVDKRTLVADTDNGSVLKQQIADLEELLEAYRCGILAEKE